MRISITVFFVLMTGTMLFGRSSGLSCWFCSSLTNKDCGDESFSGKTSLLIMKKDCAEVPAISLSTEGSVPRTVPATRCIKSQVKIQDFSALTRTCASPGEYDFTGLDESFVGCKSVQGATICMCKGDYCNGTGTSTLAIRLAIISLFTLLFI